MSYAAGWMYACDRCGATAFAESADGSMDRKRPDGWGHDVLITKGAIEMCPECFAAWKANMSEFVEKEGKACDRDHGGVRSSAEGKGAAVTTIEERREIAANLRSRSDDEEFNSENPMAIGVHLLIAICESVFPDRRSREKASEQDMLNRLADLVEPSCDRDALLKLADDLDHAGANVENVAYIDQTFHDAAHRIREACGVEA